MERPEALWGEIGHQEGHRDRAGRARAEIVEPMLAAGELPNLAQAERPGGLLARRDHLPGPDAGRLVDLRHGHEPGRPRHLRLHPPRPQDVPARPRPEPLRAEERLPAAQGGEPAARDAGLGAASAAAGIGSTIVRCPCTYPPDTVRGRMLSGMGVPDLRGGLGTSTFYTTAEGVAAARERERRAGAARRVGGDRHAPDRPAQSQDQGGPDVRRHAPPRPGGAEARPPLARDAQGAGDPLGGVERLAPGEVQGSACSSRSAGMVRFHLVRLEPELELYASPVNFDPEAPLFPISSPPDYARELARAHRPVSTRPGWSRTTPA